MRGGEQAAWPQLAETTPPTCLQPLQTHGQAPRMWFLQWQLAAAYIHLSWGSATGLSLTSVAILQVLLHLCT